MTSTQVASLLTGSYVHLADPQSVMRLCATLPDASQTTATLPSQYWALGLQSTPGMNPGGALQSPSASRQPLVQPANSRAPIAIDTAPHSIQATRVRFTSLFTISCQAYNTWREAGRSAARESCLTLGGGTVPRASKVATEEETRKRHPFIHE